MEIAKMLVLSTAHITQKAAEWLDSRPTTITVYQKQSGADHDLIPNDHYGWFIPVGHYSDPMYLEDLIYRDLPEELKKVIKYAVSKKVQWIMFDQDADTMSTLPVFKW